MAESTIPYVPSYGTITKALTKIKDASTPDRFTHDFLSSTLGLKGGTPRPVLPFLKRTGFLGTDGAPTELYKRFRNPAESGAAAAQALRHGYRPLFEVNERAYELKDSDLKGLVTQVTGLPGNSGTVRAILGSFKALNAFADFDASPTSQTGDGGASEDQPPEGTGELTRGIKLGYTINLNLPATSDIAVFNAIFKSLRENLLR